MRKITRFLTSRVFVVSLLVLIQLGYLGISIYRLSQTMVYLYWVLQLLSMIAVFWIYSKPDNPIYKISWIIPILLFPILGGIFYLYWGNKHKGKKALERMRCLYDPSTAPPPKDTEALLALRTRSKHLSRQATYISNIAGAPVWQNTSTQYLPIGENLFQHLKEELQKAQHFIFMEYFIINTGEMWNSILDILRQKASQGVEVKLMYDDIGTISTLSQDYDRTLRASGIEVQVFNRFNPRISMLMNYRDHRKICIIDGNVGFTGGANLADEYINAYDRFGHWKDTGAMIKGEAVQNLTEMFVSMWCFSGGSILTGNHYLPTQLHESDGFVQPFSDNPLDAYNCGEFAYMQIINGATRYVYITTPYLILDHEMVMALSAAAQSGVDVRIITPHKPDKWYVHAVSRSNYRPLLKSGVKIYEYQPGFMHAKMIVADDNVALVGTINMDFRSFYLHFECACAFYFSSIVHSVRDDIVRTLDKCISVTPETFKQPNPVMRLVHLILKMLSPLM